MVVPLCYRTRAIIAYAINRTNSCKEMTDPELIPLNTVKHCVPQNTYKWVIFTSFDFSITLFNKFEICEFI